MRFATIAVSAYALAASLAGTEVRAQNHSHEAGQEHPLVIEVNMADHSFSPEALRIPAGRPVQLVFMNTGEVEHEFMAGRTVADGDFEVDLFAGLDVEIRTEEAEEAEHGHEEVAEGHDDDDAEHHDNADGHHADGGDHGTMVLLEGGWAREHDLHFADRAARRMGDGVLRHRALSQRHARYIDRLLSPAAPAVVSRFIVGFLSVGRSRGVPDRT